MNNYWINVISTAHSVSFNLSIVVGIFSLFATIFLIVAEELLEQNIKLFAKIVLRFLIAFAFFNFNLYIYFTNKLI